MRHYPPYYQLAICLAPYYQDDDNYLEVYRIYHDLGGQTVHFEREEGGRCGTHYVPCALTTVHLKVMKQGITYTGYWSADGSSWTEVYQYKDVKFSNFKIGLAAVNGHASAPEIPADFDYFCVVGAAPTPTPHPRGHSCSHTYAYTDSSTHSSPEVQKMRR